MVHLAKEKENGLIYLKIIHHRRNTAPQWLVFLMMLSNPMKDLAFNFLKLIEMIQPPNCFINRCKELVQAVLIRKLMLCLELEHQRECSANHMFLIGNKMRMNLAQVTMMHLIPSRCLQRQRKQSVHIKQKKKRFLKR